MRQANTATLLLALALLAGCATKPVPSRSYITLLASPDGTVGEVLVTGAKGVQRITQAHYAAPLDGSAAAAPVDEVQFQRDFADAMAARPALPAHFVLYFETGGTRLTPESLALVPDILAQAARRAAVDMSVIGHSDSVGTPEINATISLKRAQSIAELLRSRGLQVDALTVESHGSSNQLVKTPDQTPEPRNRRVEISIR